MLTVQDAVIDWEIYAMDNAPLWKAVALSLNIKPQKAYVRAYRVKAKRRRVYDQRSMLARAALSLKQEPGRILCLEPNHADNRIRHNNSRVDMRSFFGWLEGRKAVYPIEMRTAYSPMPATAIDAALNNESSSSVAPRIEKAADGNKAATMRKILLFLLQRIDPKVLSNDFKDWDGFVKELHKQGDCLGREAQVDPATFKKHLNKARSVLVGANDAAGVE